MISVIGFTTEKELVDAYIASANVAVINASTDADSTTPVLAGIVFTNNFINGSFPADIEVNFLKNLSYD